MLCLESYKSDTDPASQFIAIAVLDCGLDSGSFPVKYAVSENIGIEPRLLNEETKELDNYEYEF
jgi:hypothetical protein